MYTNFKFHAKSQKPYSWVLKYIEPDAIYQKENVLVFIDAKYKANLYNKFGQNELLKEDHRHDMHQILAYSSFSKTEFKCGFLCYPSDQFEIKHINYKNGINEVTNTIIIIGIPLKLNCINEIKLRLISDLHEIQKKTAKPL